MTWPIKPVRVLVGFPPGGGIDIMMRLLAPALSATLGQSVVIENKPGAIGTIAKELVARSAPDGYTALCTVSASYTTTPKMVKVRYDALRDLPAVSLFAKGEQVFVTGCTSKLTNLGDAIQWVKANPAKASYGIVGKGTQDHLAGESLRQSRALNWEYIPYNGSGPIVTALMSGEILISCMGLSIALPHIAAGNLLPLAIAGTKESPFLPGVKTADLPPYVADYVYALSLPSGVPADVVSKFHAALSAAVASPAVQDEFRKRALINMQSTPVEAANTLREDTAAIAPLLASLNLQPV